MSVQFAHIPVKTDWTSIFVVCVVCTLETIRVTTVDVNSWAFLLSLNTDANENFFGLVNSLQPLCLICASLFGGWLSNRISHTKPPIIFGTLLTALSCLFYANIGLLPLNLKKWAFLVTQMLTGFGSGLMTTWRVHVAMASTEVDRAKANSLVGFGIHLGFLLGPLFILALGYVLTTDGFPLLWGTTLNLYTAPGYLTALFSLGTCALLLAFFDGKMVVAETTKNSEPRKQSNCWLQPESCVKLDYRAIIACFCSKMSSTAMVVFLVSLSAPFAMTTFGWSGQQAIMNFMLMQGIGGVIGILVNVGYAVNILNRLKERFCILFGMACFLGFFLLTFQWPFLTAKMPTPLYKNVTLANGTITLEKVAEGCDPNNFSWCTDTPAISPYVFLAAYIIVHGIGLPLGQLNLDVLYSKLLGPIKQGTMQGLFMGVGNSLSVVGPSVVTSVYQSFGPRPVWLAEIVIFIAAICVCLANYGRLKLRDCTEEQKSKSSLTGQTVLVSP